MNILALDLSLRGAAMLIMPAGWSGDWDAIPRRTYGEKLEKNATAQERLGRGIRITSEIMKFANMWRPQEVHVEEYAFNQSARGTRDIAELGGMVKHQLATQLGLVPTPVVASSARKILLGNLPRRDVKDAVMVFLHRMGLPHDWTEDEADAFVIANYAASAIGGFAFVTAPVEKKVKRRAA
jgi:Holliday junction resolvasome RuvABC endonuclease subunit